MRSRKARGKKKAVVTMTEGEIVEACMAWLDKKGIVVADYCWLKVNTTPKPKRRGRRVEFSTEVQGSGN